MSDPKQAQSSIIDPNIYKKRIQLDDGPEIKSKAPKDDPKSKS